MDLEIDTLHFAECHHKVTGPCATPGSFPRGDQVEDGKLVNCVIGLLAEEAEDVKDITSLAVCGCQIGGHWSIPSRDALMNDLKKYQKLSDIIVVRVVTANAVKELGGEDGLAEIMREGTHVYKATEKEKMRLWDSLKLAVYFKRVIGDSFAEESDAGVAPLVRYAAVMDGKLVWEQNLRSVGSVYYGETPSGIRTIGIWSR